MRFRSYLIAIPVAMACVVGTAVPTHAKRSSLLESTSYGPPYSESTSETTQGDCSTPDVCESSASADALTGQAACRSDVAKTGPTSTIGKAWVEDQEILVPFRSTRMSATSRWHVTGTSSASGDATANATVRLQILDTSGALLQGGADSGAFGVGLFVDGFNDPAGVVNEERHTGEAWADLGPAGKAPTKLTLRAILQCDAGTGGRPVNGVFLPGSATVDVVTGAQATRLLELGVNFYR